MDKKAIIIIWKFDADDIINDGFQINIEDQESSPHFDILSENNNNKLICYVLQKNESQERFNEIIKKVIKHAEELTEFEKIILLHDKPEFQLKDGNWHLSVHKFGGGYNKNDKTRTLHNPVGPLDDVGGLNKTAFIENKILKDDIFDNIWKEYQDNGGFNQNQIKINTTELKKKIIELWLPLAIDIQGLYETKGNADYFDKVKNSLNNRKSDIVKEWETIKDNINIYDTNFDPIKLVDKFTSQNIDKVKNSGYISNNNNIFFPKILEELIKKIEDNIK